MTMKTYEPIILNSGVVIDPDDDARIIEHKGYLEFIYDDGVVLYDGYYGKYNY